MQLMVARFNNYQELVDRALMIEGKQQQIENHKRKYGQGKYNSGAQQKPRYTPKQGVQFQHTHGGGSSHNHNGHKNGNGNGGSNGQNRTTPSIPAKKDLSHAAGRRQASLGTPVPRTPTLPITASGCSSTSSTLTWFTCPLLKGFSFLPELPLPFPVRS